MKVKVKFIKIWIKSKIIWVDTNYWKIKLFFKSWIYFIKLSKIKWNSFTSKLIANWINLSNIRLMNTLNSYTKSLLFFETPISELALEYNWSLWSMSNHDELSSFLHICIAHNWCTQFMSITLNFNQNSNDTKND